MHGSTCLAFSLRDSTLCSDCRIKPVGQLAEEEAVSAAYLVGKKIEFVNSTVGIALTTNEHLAKGVTAPRIKWLGAVF